jgi:hypothetical protein
LFTNEEDKGCWEPEDSGFLSAKSAYSLILVNLLIKVTLGSMTKMVFNKIWNSHTSSELVVFYEWSWDACNCMSTS